MRDEMWNEDAKVAAGLMQEPVHTQARVLEWQEQNVDQKYVSKKKLAVMAHKVHREDVFASMLRVRATKYPIHWTCLK